MFEVQLIVLGCLVWASIQDLESHRVSDVVWMAGGFLSMLVTSFIYGVSALPGMVSQALILFVLGLGLHLFASFGVADVIALGFIGLAVPGLRPLTLGAGVLAVAIAYQRVYFELKKKRIISPNPDYPMEAVPLIPGILFGYMAVLLVF